jgi:hypothetical protein
MNETARAAIERELSYLEDNLYRHQHFTDKPDLAVIASHKIQIKQLKEALEQ